MSIKTNRVAPGTKVGVRFGGRVVPAHIVEDRGVFRDHRIVRVRIDGDSDPEALEFELPAEELEPVPSAA